MSDIELIDIILSGDKNKYAILIEKYQPMVFRVCRGFVFYKEDADDLMQEVFIKVFRALDTFNQQAAFSTWLYRITLNTCLNYKRKTERNQFFLRFNKLGIRDLKKSETLMSESIQQADQPMIDNQHATQIKQAINRLPEKQQAAFVLSKYEDMPQQEIAQVMNISVGAVEQLLFRARENLRIQLAEYYKQNFQQA
ncbi:MAG: RNA polymerase sigma factor [Bacteroidales bacterium]|nr:RNA polymerase sigma factor [Bacteroidales bacterium]